MSRPGVVVARDEVLARAGTLLDAVRSGAGATIVLEGPAGIGKTTVAQRIVDQASRDGFTVRVAAAQELERDLPLAPFADALGLDPAAEDERRAELGALLRGDVSTVDAGQGRWRLASGVADIVEAEARRQPVLLVVEDAHWLDPTSAVVLGRLLAVQDVAPLALLVTARPEPAPDHVAAVWRRLLDAGALVLPLHPLDDEAVASLVQHATSAEPGPDLLAALARAGGNPLYVTELLDAYRDAGTLEVEDGTAELASLELPPSLRLTLVRRLGSLPTSTVAMLRHAAVLGRVSQLEHLAVVSGQATADVLAALEPAYRAHLLEPADTHIRFRHELIRDALYDDVPAVTRAALHTEAARALERGGAPARQLAVHLDRGLEPTGEEDVACVLRVVDDVVDQAPALARALTRRAASAPAASRDQQLQLRILEARAGLMLGATDEVATLLGSLGGDALADDARLELWRALTVARDVRREVDAPPLDDYLALVRAAEVSESVRRGHLAVIATVGAAFDPPRSHGIAKELLDDPDLGAGETAVLARTAAARSAMFLGSIDEAYEHSRRAVEVSRASERELTWAGVEAVSTYAFLRSVDPTQREAVVSLVTEALEAAEAVGLVHALPRLHAELVRVGFFQGQHDHVLTHAETIHRLADETGFDDLLSVADSMAARIELLRGLDARAEERFERLAATAESVEPGGVHVERDIDVIETEVPFDRARLALIAGEAEAAWVACRPAVERMLAMGPSGFVFSLWSLPYVQAALATGHRDDAEAWADQLQEYARNGHPLDVLADLARLPIEPSPAAAQTLLTALETVPVFPLALDGYRIVGEALTSLGDREGAVAALQRGRALADEAGALVLVAAYDAALRELGVRRGAAEGPRRPDTGWDALTEAEWRVVELVVEGLVYREVGERLFISRRTVETHVANAFRKLGLRSRNELTRAYLEHQGTST